MTKFTAALITILVAGVVPFCNAICKPTEIGLGQEAEPLDPQLKALSGIFANDCGAIVTRYADANTNCDDYPNGAHVYCTNGNPYWVTISDATWTYCYETFAQCDGMNILYCCGHKPAIPE